MHPTRRDPPRDSPEAIAHHIRAQRRQGQPLTWHIAPAQADLDGQRYEGARLLEADLGPGDGLGLVVDSRVVVVPYFEASTLLHWAADCAEAALPLFERRHDDLAPRNAIKRCRVVALDPGDREFMGEAAQAARAVEAMIVEALRHDPPAAPLVPARQRLRTRRAVWFAFFGESAPLRAAAAAMQAAHFASGGQLEPLPVGPLCAAHEALRATRASGQPASAVHALQDDLHARLVDLLLDALDASASAPG